MKKTKKQKMEINNMRDYSIEEAIEIINQCDESIMPDSKHFNLRNIQRIDDLGLIFETFLYKPLMGILKQDYNKFRLYFEHATKSSKDLSLVIVINDNRTIKFLTIIETLKSKRVK